MSGSAAPTSSAGRLEVRGLTARYRTGGDCLHDVSLSVGEGEVVALLGVNGAGKTSLARAVTGMLAHHGGRVVAGSVSWDGADTTGAPPGRLVRRGVSQVLEGRKVFADLTVEQNLTVGGFTRRNDRALREVRAQVLDMFPRLAERRAQQAGYLSGGEQQMLAIGRALMQSPRLVVLDEPSLGLAPLIVAQVRDTIAALRDRGVGVLLVEQNVTMALSVASRACVLAHGRVTRSGPAAEFLADPDVQRFYLGLDDDGPVAGTGAVA